jgi:hypothetical protein
MQQSKKIFFIIKFKFIVCDEVIFSHVALASSFGENFTQEWTASFLKVLPTDERSNFSSDKWRRIQSWEESEEEDDLSELA